MPLAYNNSHIRNQHRKNYDTITTTTTIIRQKVHRAPGKRSASASVVVLAHRDKLSKRVASARSRSSAAQAEMHQNITRINKQNIVDDDNSK